MNEFRKIAHRIAQLNLIHRIHIQRVNLKHGLYPGQMPILHTILERNGCTQKEIATHLQISPPSVATSIKRMQKAGLVTKEVVSNDMRCTKIMLTERGRVQCEACHMACGAVDKQMMKGFSPTEIDTLCGYFDRMIHNIDNDELAHRSIISLMEETKKNHPSENSRNGVKPR